jgi:hypothetical protein
VRGRDAVVCVDLPDGVKDREETALVGALEHVEFLINYKLAPDSNQNFKRRGLFHFD